MAVSSDFRLVILMVPTTRYSSDIYTGISVASCTGTDILTRITIVLYYITGTLL